jgi:hypothetical protein
MEKVRGSNPLGSTILVGGMNQKELVRYEFFLEVACILFGISTGIWLVHNQWLKFYDDALFLGASAFLLVFAHGKYKEKHQKLLRSLDKA